MSIKCIKCEAPLDEWELEEEFFKENKICIKCHNKEVEEQLEIYRDLEDMTN